MKSGSSEASFGSSAWRASCSHGDALADRRLLGILQEPDGAGIDQTADRRIEVELRLAVDLVVERVDLGIERRQAIAVAGDGEGAHDIGRACGRSGPAAG